jgi:hypothetical protein
MVARSFPMIRSIGISVRLRLRVDPRTACITSRDLPLSVYQTLLRDSFCSFIIHQDYLVYYQQSLIASIMGDKVKRWGTMGASLLTIWVKVTGER